MNLSKKNAIGIFKKTFPIALLIILSLLETAFITFSNYLENPAEFLSVKMVFLYDFSVVFTFNCFFTLLIRRRVVWLAIPLLGFCLIGVINAIKIKETGIPLLFTDILLFRNLKGLYVYAVNPKTAAVLCGLLCLTGCLILLRKKVVAFPSKTIACLALVALTGMLHLFSGNGPRKFENAYWNFRSTAKANGFFAMQYHYSERRKIPKPPSYNAQKDKLASQLVDICHPHGNAPTRHVVAFLLESMWNIEKHGYQFNAPAMPFYNSLVKRETATPIIVPTFGGSTANAEFEFLTAIPASYFPLGTIAYTQYMRAPVASIASVFKSLGYEASAVHNFHGWFWHRDAIYKLMGFDSFTSLEHMDGIQWSQNWPEDKKVFDFVFEKLKNEDKPQFVFGVTVNTHGPYNDPPSVEDVVVAGKDPYGNPAPPEAIAYANRLRKLDNNLKQFFENLKTLKHKPIVILFGDHLPAFAQEHQKVEEKFQTEMVFVDLNLTPKHAPMPLHCAGSELLKELRIEKSIFHQTKENWCDNVMNLEITDAGPVSKIDEDEELSTLIYNNMFGDASLVPSCLLPSI